MDRRRVVALVLVVLVAAGVAMLALRNRQPPLQPRDADHRWSGAAACLTCHGPSGSMPRSEGHPLGDDCLRCHSMP